MEEKLRNPKRIKKESWTFASRDCINCVNKNSCIRCSSLNQPLRQIFLNTLGYKKKENEAMRLGTEKHLEYFKDLKELDEYGVKNFFADLYQGKEIVIKELSVCSRQYGLRGHIDCLTVKYDGSAYHFEVTELKPKYNRSHLFQAWAYALILSDPFCNLMYKVKKRKEYSLTKRLYPNKPLMINIRIKFKYYKTNTEYSGDWVTNNTIKLFVGPVMAKSKRIRKFMGAGEFYLSNLKPCSFCKYVECDFRDICSRYPYSKTTQRYFGKNKVIRKSRF